MHRGKYSFNVTAKKGFSQGLRDASSRTNVISPLSWFLSTFQKCSQNLVASGYTAANAVLQTSHRLETIFDRSHPVRVQSCQTYSILYISEYSANTILSKCSSRVLCVIGKNKTVRDWLQKLENLSSGEWKYFW